MALAHRDGTFTAGAVVVLGVVVHRRRRIVTELVEVALVVVALRISLPQAMPPVCPLADAVPLASSLSLLVLVLETVVVTIFNRGRTNPS